MEQIRKIEIVPRISRIALVGLWLVVFLLPSMLLLGGLHALISRDEHLQRALIEQFLMEEMKQFEKDLMPQRFFEHCFSKAAASFDAAAAAGDPIRSLKRWGASFSADLGSTFHLFAIGDHSGRYFSLKAPRLAPEAWPRNRCRLAMHELFSLHLVKTNGRSYNKSDYRNAATFLEQIYGQNGALILYEGSSGIPQAIFSRFDPDTAIWYSRFIACKPGTQTPSWHALVTIREDRINVKKRLAFAASGVINEKFRRTLALVGGAQSPRFIVNAETLWFIDVLPVSLEKQILRSRRKPAGSRLPMAAVGVPLSAFAHPLRPLFPLVQTAVFLLLALSAIFITTLAKGDRRLSLGIRGKILLAIGVGIWIPLIGTILSLLSYQRLHERSYANDTLDEFERHLETTEMKLAGLDTFLGLDILDARKRLEGTPETFSFDRISRLIRFHGGIPFRTNILTITADGSEALPDLETLGSAAISGESQDFVLKIFRGFAIDLMFGLGSVQTFQPDPKKQQKLRTMSDLTQGLGDTFIDPKFFNRLMTSPGKLFLLPFSQIFERTGAFLLYPGGDRNQPPYALTAMTCLFNRRYQDFLKFAAPVEALLKPLTQGYTVKQGLYKFDSKKRLALDMRDFPPVSSLDPELQRIALQCANEQTDLRYDRSRHARPRLIVARNLRDVPFVGAMIAEPVSGRQNLHLAFVVIGIAILLFAGASFGTATLLWRPLKSCLTAIRRTASGRYDWRLDVQTGDELETFADALNDMVAGIRERERMSRFVSDEAMAIAASDDDSMMRPGGEYRDVTVMTSDIRDFTTLSEAHLPEEIVAMLNTYFTRMEACIIANGGTIDKFVGDALTAVFRDDARAGDQAFRACSAALEMRRELASLNRERDSSGLFTIRTGIGIASGRVIAGRVGSSSGRLDATFIGEAVMLASFVETRSKQALRTGIVVAPSTVRLLRGRGRLEFLERITPEGKSRAFSLYELTDLRDSFDEGDV
ncbi:adenylate/guanylate cyclase domain-containing protein [Candidatus Ozemobacteraceae bacterium]|nr:adenylate/guanylate cyclase domain-containing protein [Candidatus Ozemobacteraceae bacterium]